MGGHAVSLFGGGAIHFQQKIITLVVRLRLNHGHARYLNVRIKYGNKFIVNCGWSSFFFSKERRNCPLLTNSQPLHGKMVLKNKIKNRVQIHFRKKFYRRLQAL